MRLRHYMYRGETYVRGVCHDNIAFYMFLPTKIDRAAVFRHGDQNHITMARAVISASPRNRICEANEMLSSRRATHHENPV